MSAGFAAGVGNLKPQLHSAVSRTTERRKTEHFGVMFVRQIVDPAEDRQVRIDVVFRREIDEVVILDVEVRSAEI